MSDALNKAGFDYNNPEHILVSCGDLLDRGDFTLKTLQFVNGLPPERKILVRGNHEDLLEECLARKEFLMHDLHNGTVKTIVHLCNEPEEVSYILSTWNDQKIFEKASKNEELKKYFLSLVDYAEVGNYVFVHGWIPRKETNKSWKRGDWKTARWYNGMEKWHVGRRLKDKTIICGHWHCSWGNSKLHKKGTEWNKEGKSPTADFSPFIDEGIIALDACTAYSHQANCIVLEI